MSWDYVLKFVIIGDGASIECRFPQPAHLFAFGPGDSVGKSSILFRLTDQKFLNNPDPTLGADFGAKLISTDGKTCKLQCWDTAGTESFRSITRSYYRGAAGALIVYDVTRRTSFDNCRSWLKDVRQHADPHLTAILVANKVDLCESDAGGESRSRHRREVTTEEGERFAQEEGLLFIEASAKSGHNVEAAFDEAARDILRKIQSGVFNDSKSPGVHSAGRRAAPTADPNTSLTLETQEPKAACCRT